MPTETQAARAETAVGIIGVLTGLGVLTFALFPFALPILILLAVSAIPLLPIAVLGAVLVAGWLVVRALVRLLSSRARSGRARAGAPDRRAGRFRRSAPAPR